MTKRFLLIALLVCVCPAAAHSQAALVQEGGGTNSAANTCVCTFGSTFTAGNLLVAYAMQSGTFAVNTLAGGGGAWTGLASAAPGALQSGYSVSTGTGNTVTFTFAATETGACKCAEFSGIDTTSPLDQNPADTSGSDSTLEAPSITSTQTALLVAAYGWSSTRTVSSHASTPDSYLATTPAGTALKAVLYYKLSAAAGVKTAVLTVSGAAVWGADHWAFKHAAAGAPPKRLLTQGVGR